MADVVQLILFVTDCMNLLNNKKFSLKRTFFYIKRKENMCSINWKEEPRKNYCNAICDIYLHGIVNRDLFFQICSEKIFLFAQAFRSFAQDNCF